MNMTKKWSRWTLPAALAVVLAAAPALAQEPTARPTIRIRGPDPPGVNEKSPAWPGFFRVRERHAGGRGGNRTPDTGIFKAHSEEACLLIESATYGACRIFD